MQSTIMVLWNIVFTLFFLELVKTFDLGFNKLSSEESFLLWREIDFVENQQTALVSLTVPIIFAHQQFSEILIDRDGFVILGLYSNKLLLKEILSRDNNGKVKIENRIAILSPFKAQWDTAKRKGKISYRILTINDSLLHCADKDLIENLGTIIQRSFQVNFVPKEIILTSWMNMTSITSQNINESLVSFEQAILSNGFETFQILYYTSIQHYQPSTPLEEGFIGIFSKKKNRTLTIPLEFHQEPKNSLFVIQIDKINEENLESMEYNILPFDDNAFDIKSYCKESEFMILPLNNSLKLFYKNMWQDILNRAQSDSVIEKVKCDTETCDPASACQPVRVGKCCRCQRGWTGDGVTCVYLPSTTGPPVPLNYEGILNIENGNLKLGHQSFRLSKIVNNRIESNRILVKVEYSNDNKFMLLSYSMPTLFLIPMWIVANPVDGGKNLIQLTGGEIKSVKSLCSLGKSSTYYIEGLSSRLSPDLKGSWYFNVKVFGGENVNSKVSDLDLDTNMFIIKFRKNNDVLIENEINLILDGNKVPFKCRTEMKLERGCIQDPDLENKNMYLIFERTSFDLKPESGAFFVSKVTVTMNPCVVKDVACPMPNTTCIRDSTTGQHRCICDKGFIMIENVCEAKPKEYECSVRCHANAVCISKDKCQCNPGFEGSGYYCFDCRICHKDAECVPKSNICRCKIGFTGNGFNCQSEKLCSRKCHDNATCIAGYCKCNVPLIGDGINSCFDCMVCDKDADCSPIDQRCYCRPTFFGDGFKCTNCVEKCHQYAQCINGKCLCKLGFKGDGVISCFSCSLCHSDASCLEVDNKCICKSGFVGNGMSCLEKRVCSQKCHNAASCVKGFCICRSGFSGDGIKSCFDCRKCDKNSVCFPEKEKCECKPGFEGDGYSCTEAQRCKQKCHKLANCINGNCYCVGQSIGDGINFCFDCGKCSNDATCIPNLEKCQCNDEFEGDGISCVKGFLRISCNPPCGASARCNNGTCECLPGLQGNPLQHCFDCRPCSPLAECDIVNRRCVCSPGNVGDGITCAPAPELRCHKKAFYTNRQCQCIPGFVGDGISYCFDCFSCDKNAFCEPKKERCTCNKGFKGNGTQCKLIKEERCFPPCGEKAQCKYGNCECLPMLEGNPLQNCFDCRPCGPSTYCDIINKRCVCRPGYYGDGITCIEDKSCSQKCHTNGFCNNGQCLCLPGFEGDGIGICFNCSSCDKNGICLYREERCKCNEGYEGDGRSCRLIKPVDCQPPCGENSRCMNKKCMCFEGFQGDPLKHCFDCRVCGAFSMCDIKEKRCICKEGYYGDGMICVPRKECKPDCLPTARCVNKVCECLPGLIGDGVKNCYNCSLCDINADCVFSQRKCICKSGFIGDGRKCIPIQSRCSENCHKEALCVNGQCRCLPGLIGDGIRFCFSCSTCDINASCSPSEERCICNNGFEGDGKKCSAIGSNSCYPFCGENAYCKNQICQCPSGFQGNPLQHCFDCQTCNKFAFCDAINKKCVCLPEFIGDGFTCERRNAEGCLQQCHKQSICVNGQCQCASGLIGDGIKYCFNCSTCDRNALCVPNEENCKCNKGFEGDGRRCSLYKPKEMCRPSCGKNAFCSNGNCQCPYGFQGNPFQYCFDCKPCSAFAKCDVINERCTCLQGYVGDGITCVPVDQTQCHKMAVLSNGVCKCFPGLEGDGKNICFNCKLCDQNAKCIPNEERCICNNGFSGDGKTCKSNMQGCDQICHPKAICINGICRCNKGLNGNGINFCFNCSICGLNSECLPHLSRCQCLPGFKGDGLTCTKLDECSPRCHLQASCINSNCHCFPGLTGNGVSSCYDCSLCHPNAECKPEENRCICAKGYSGNGFTCTQVRSPECKITCHKDAICIQDTCICKQGFTGDGNNYCFDCQRCDSNAVCKAMEQKCVCKLGFRGDGYSCEKMTENLSCNAECHPNATRINNCCKCKTGFIGDGFLNCFDCNRCSQNADCLPFSSQCRCREGFQGDGYVCQPKVCIPPCSPNTSTCIKDRCVCHPGLIGDGYKCLDCRKCHEKASCNLKVMKCECLPGYVGDGINCVSVGGCVTSLDCAQPNEVCSRLHGTLLGQCTCSPTSIRDPQTKQCRNIECQPSCHSKAECIQGKCICFKGYIGDGYQCNSSNNCDSDTDCTQSSEVCRKETGSSIKKCLCTTGTFRSPNGHCELPKCPNGCHEKALCIAGSNQNSRCICLPGYLGNGVTSCVDCSRCDKNAICSENQGCVCKSNFVGDGKQCFSLNECSIDDDCYMIRGNSSSCVTLFNGNQNCICRQGFTLREEICKPLDCVYPCAKDAVCILQQCHCRPGFIGNGYIKCFDCSKCDENAQCLDQKGCVCNVGFIGNGLECKRSDQCKQDSECCDINKICLETPGDLRKRCVCRSEFIPSGSLCIPKVCSDKCHPLAKCKRGKCECQEGYIGDGIQCRQPDECKSNSDCKYLNQECVPRMDSSLTCQCKIGYQWRPSVLATMAFHRTRKRRAILALPGCVPIVCVPKCHYSSFCIFGACVCPATFKGNGYSGCIDCSKCSPNANCDDDKGCVCKSSYKGDGITCVPEDKCRFHSDCDDLLKVCVQSADMSRKCFCKSGSIASKDGQCIMTGCSTKCDKNAICISNQCVCNTGFTGNGEICKLRDFCTNDSDCKSQNSRCEMTLDYVYRCVCQPGFRDSNGLCVEKKCEPKCHLLAKCFSQTCHCIPGHFGDGVKTCNSCSLCNKNAICLPDSGCKCKNNFIGDGFNCRPLDACRIDADCRDSNMLCLLNSQEKNLQCFCKLTHELVNNVCQPRKCFNKCHKNAKCIFGECVCDSGYSGDGVSCSPQGECGINIPCKDKFSVCQVVPETQKMACVCISGFKTVNLQCQPETCPIQCHPMAQCKSGICVCSPGYKGDGIRNCVKCSSCDRKATCTLDGCKCIPGFQGDGFFCQPEDQCRYDSDCRDRYALCIGGPERAKNCLCKPGFWLQNNICVPIPCYPPCQKNSMCFLGECVCKEGFTLDINGTSCIQTDHCQNDLECPDPNHQCMYLKPLQGKRCICKKGFLAKSQLQCIEEGCTNKCHRFAECQDKTCKCRARFEGDGVINCFDCSLCHPNAICSPTSGCVCQSPEYFGDGKSCRPKDECRLDSDCRDENALCSTLSGSLKCTCKSGYSRLKDSICSPLPCIKPCSVNQDCVNGQCQCKKGYISYKDLICVQQHECDINKTNSCTNPNEICTKISESTFKCICKPGFVNMQGYCLPINCYQPCHINGHCNAGICTCNPGYKGDGITTCNKINECERDSDCYKTGSLCVTSGSSKKCECPKDFNDQNGKCVLKECKPQCDTNAICDVGNCICKIGFVGNGYMCIPKNECEPEIGCPDPNSVCVRSFPIPFFKCLCKPGFISFNSQALCKPIDCNPDCHMKASCIMGMCICKKPLIGDGVNECKPPDECSQTQSCTDPNAQCLKSQSGNLKCLCKTNFNLENNKCIFNGDCKINTDCSDKKFCINAKCTCPDPYIMGPVTKACELPRIAIIPTKQEVFEGSDVEIVCFFENGIGNINILNWRKISPLVYLNFIRQKASIKIKVEKTTVLDSGIYQCCISMKSDEPLYCQSAVINVFTEKCGKCTKNMHCDPLTNMCICDAGFQLDYRQICKPINCINFPEICDKITMNCEEGVCICKSEYFLSNKVCTPKDQCKTDKDCAPQAICKTDGRCHCGPLFIGPGKICDPINLGCEVTKDCDSNAVCVQIGVSPTRVCQCNPGFIGDGKSCKQSGPIANLLISQGYYIWKLPSVKRKKRSILETKSFNPFSWKKLSPDDEISAIETNCKSKTVFWILRNRPGIFSAPYSSPDSTNPVILTNMKVTAIAVDWVSGNLFWTSKPDKTLGMINISNGLWSIIFLGLSSPGQIAVNSKDGEIFWISESKDFPKIEFAYMDGTGYRPLITEFKNTLISLAFDIVTDFLCWIETDTLSGTSTVSCLHKVVKEAILLHMRSLQAYSSTIINIAKTEMGNPFTIKAYYSKIFWITEADKNYLYIYETKTVTRYVDVKSLASKYSSLAVLPDVCEPITNSCSEMNMYGNCRYLCLPSKNKGRICVCPQGMQECQKYQ